MRRASASVDVEAPDASPDWHPVARRWYEALTSSAQTKFYEPSDWAVAYLLAESMSRDLNPQFVGFQQTGRDQTEPAYESVPLKGASLSAYLRAMTDLLVTEGARRRAQVELQQPEPASDLPDNVVDWSAYAAGSARA